MEIRVTDIRPSQFDEESLREVITYVAKIHPEILREIMCEECPEHMGVPEK